MMTQYRVVEYTYNLLSKRFRKKCNFFGPLVKKICNVPHFLKNLENSFINRITNVLQKIAKSFKEMWEIKNRFYKGS